MKRIRFSEEQIIGVLKDVLRCSNGTLDRRGRGAPFAGMMGFVEVSLALRAAEVRRMHKES